MKKRFKLFIPLWCKDAGYLEVPVDHQFLHC